MNIDEAMRRQERGNEGEDVPYTREEAKALIAHVRNTLRERLAGVPRLGELLEAVERQITPGEPATRLLLQD